jgi:hypothetical protein
MAGPLGSNAPVDPHPVESQPERFRDSAFCGRCHEDTYREWLATAPSPGTSCQACHMPAVIRKVTQATDLLSSVLVSLEPGLPLRAHTFSSRSALDESARVLGSDFLELGLVDSGEGLRIAIENRLPHSIPTGGFGGKRLAVAVAVDGVEIARRELSNRPGKAFRAGEVLRFETFLNDGSPHRIEGSLLETGKDAPVLWRRMAEWTPAR